MQAARARRAAAPPAERSANEQHDDWHPNTPPWTGPTHQGDAAITVPGGEWTWDSPWKDVL
eukprot:COSAG01_NODE_1870_length_9013_cov_4.865268_9_plen_60_part_01